MNATKHGQRSAAVVSEMKEFRRLLKSLKVYEV